MNCIADLDVEDVCFVDRRHYTRLNSFLNVVGCGYVADASGDADAIDDRLR